MYAQAIRVLATALAALPLLAGTGAVGATVHVVTISGFEYVPDRLTIVQGDTVEFEASGKHPLQFDEDAFDCPATCQVIFSMIGDVGFYCGIHGLPGAIGMSGIVTVLELPLFTDGFE